MLQGSQPLDPKVAEKLGLDNTRKPDTVENEIISQYIGTMAAHFSDKTKKEKPSLKTRIGWQLRRIKASFHDACYTIRNHRKWHKTLCRLRPWEGFDGLIRVMLMHLQDYKENEEKHGNSAPEYKEQKIATVKETIKLLEHMKDPQEYLDHRRKEVKIKYPAYQSLITTHKGGTVFSGDFVSQGAGWAGIESGKDPRMGYFEFVDGRFELVASPDPVETDRLLEEIREYHEDLDASCTQAQADSDRDFERLTELMKDNLYAWWD